MVGLSNELLMCAKMFLRGFFSSLLSFGSSSTDPVLLPNCMRDRAKPFELCFMPSCIVSYYIQTLLPTATFLADGKGEVVLFFAGETSVLAGCCSSPASLARRACTAACMGICMFMAIKSGLQKIAKHILTTKTHRHSLPTSTTKQAYPRESNNNAHRAILTIQPADCCT